MKNRILNAAPALLLAGLTIFGGSAAAQTADGETPANEGVCNSLEGGTPGLYGLCVAYCEAQDLDLVGDKETPNNKILANYRKKMQPGDPDMPCVQVPCPCWTAGQLANVGASATPTCNIATSNAIVGLAQPGLLQRAVADVSNTLCRFTDTTAGVSVRFEISADEAQSCYSQIVDKCAALGQ